MNLITIITPAYNRAHELVNLFNSLLKQNLYNFEWLIVDDGSTDDTKEIVQTFQTEKFPLRYHYKENGGKHTALNIAFQLAHCELSFIVDSDDILLPDATQTIEEDWSKYRDPKLCGISYLRGYNANQVIKDSFPHDYEIDNFINMRFNNHINGDKAEVWVTEYLKQHPYPVFENEKFFGESYLWTKLAEEYDMLFRNKIIYITEYLEGGLSQSGRSLRIRCPKGGMKTASIMLNKRFSLDQRIKGAILYSCYSFFARQSFFQILEKNHFLLITLCYPIGWFLYLRWRKFL